MFIRKALILKINETYFKKYKHHEDLFVLQKECTLEDVKKLLSVLSNLEHIKGFNLSEGTDSYVALVQDLERTFYEDSNFRTFYAGDLQATRIIYAMRVERSIPMMGTVTEVIKILGDLSPNSCLVGGSVRDSIQGQDAKDFDFVTDVDYDKLKEKFESCGFTTKETGKNFLVLNVIKDGEEFEIANFRKDGTYEDGRRPESVEIGTIFDDAQRRDFTVNALYFRLHDHYLADPNGFGIPDAKGKILRFVGKPEKRLQEDSLRIFRFYRFVSKGYVPAPKDLRAVRTLFGDSYERTDAMRVQQEIEKMIGL